MGTINGLFLDQPEQFPADPYTSVTWLQVLRDLGMHVTPSTADVIRAAQILAEKLSYEHSDAALLQSLQSFWTFALEEKLLQSLPQLSSLKLVVALWDHRERVGVELGVHGTRVVVPLNHVGFDIERELVRVSVLKSPRSINLAVYLARCGRSSQSLTAMCSGQRWSTSSSRNTVLQPIT